MDDGRPLRWDDGRNRPSPFVLRQSPYPFHSWSEFLTLVIISGENSLIPWASRAWTATPSAISSSVWAIYFQEHFWPISWHRNSFSTRPSASSASTGDGLLKRFFTFPTMSGVSAFIPWTSLRCTATTSASNSSVLAICFHVQLFPRLAHLNSLMEVSSFFR